MSKRSDKSRKSSTQKEAQIRVLRSIFLVHVTRGSCCLKLTIFFFQKIDLKEEKKEKKNRKETIAIGGKKENITRSGVRTHADNTSIGS